MTLTQHHYDLKRHRVTGQYRGQCSCGWFYIGDTAEQVDAKWATHDIEWETVRTQEAAHG